MRSPAQSIERQGTSLDETHFARSLGEIAAELGVTRQRVLAIEKRALAKLQAELERRGLSLDDLITRP